MRHLTLVYKRGRPDAAALAADLASWLASLGYHVVSRENADAAPGPPGVEIPPETEAVLVLGGDGTLLSVARSLGGRETPLIGVNLGAFGFLTEVAKENCRADLETILAGRMEIEERMRLQVSIERGGREVFSLTVLNDAVVNKGALARIVDLTASVNGRHLTRYRADGLIAATATGSTAYNLSAGGPIVYPTARAIILTPICSFTLTTRPIILPARSLVEVRLDDRVRDIALTCDGQVGQELEPGDIIRIRCADTPLRLVKAPATDYFEILRTKLRWEQ